MHDVFLVRLFMAGFFTVLGAYLLVIRDRFATAGTYFCAFDLDEPAQARLESAYERRESSEALPSAWMAGALGGISLVLALLTLLTQMPVVLLYATLAVALALILTFAYARLEGSTARRVASLRARPPSAIAPLYVWTLVAMTAVLPLLWLPSSAAAASLVTVAGITTSFLAWRVAALPARLGAEDVIVDTFVDTRLRTARVMNLLGTAVAPSFVFESFTGYSDSRLHIGALLIAFAALVATTSLQWRLLHRIPSQAEVSTWFYAAP